MFPTESARHTLPINVSLDAIAEDSVAAGDLHRGGDGDTDGAARARQLPGEIELTRELSRNTEKRREKRAAK